MPSRASKQWLSPGQLLYVLAVIVASALVSLGLSHLRLPAAGVVSPVDGPITLAGVVTSGGQPQAGLFVALHTDRRRLVGVTRTDGAGRFTLAAREPGTYRAAIGTQRALPSTSRDLSLNRGHNDIVIELPPTEIRVQLVADLARDTELVQVVLHGPADEASSRKVGFVRAADGLVARFVGVGFGEYRVSAFTIQGASARTLAPARFELSANRPTVEAEVRLTNDQLKVQVVDTLGRPIDYAEIGVLSQRLERLAPNSFDAGWVPAGEEMVVRAAGLLSVCRQVTDRATQIVELQPLGAAQATIRLLDAAGIVGGSLTGLPGSNCGVPVGTLDIDWSAGEDGQVDMTLRGLPVGDYGYVAADRAQAERIQVPGPLLVYRVPLSCRMCAVR